MNRAALSTLIAQLGGVPSIERMAILQEALDEILDRIESLETTVRILRIQARPFKGLVSDDSGYVRSNATLNESRQPRQRTPAKRRKLTPR